MKPRSLLSLRRIAVLLAAALAGLTLVATPAGAQERGPRAAFSGPSAKGTTVTTQVAGAPILCEVNYGNDVTLSGGLLNVTWAVLCRYTDDGQFAKEVKDITMLVTIFQNNRIVGESGFCPASPEAFKACIHRVPFPGGTGRIHSEMYAKVTWNDGYPPIAGVFASPGFTIT
ncbi:hypothetical protein Adi01nite_13350 [Amorphoplanes digitatis]|nr:hypothetical protein Adi01nite_13350 [Actinoplanes digitatis]